MNYKPYRHHRRSIRLKGYDYSQPGWYFITIVVQNRQMLFGDVVNGEMVLNNAGRIADQCWREIPKHYPNVQLDEYVIMPNHVHGIIGIIMDDKNAGAKNFTNVGVQNFEPLRFESMHRENKYQKIIPRSIGSIIRGFKIGVTKWFRQNTEIYTVWQRNYWDHIIRNEIELNRIRDYIINNPKNWNKDRYRF